MNSGYFCRSLPSPLWIFHCALPVTIRSRYVLIASNLNSYHISRRLLSSSADQQSAIDTCVTDDIISKRRIPTLAPIHMRDYSYELREECIAKYPASPRGSSRLLYVNSNGLVTHFDNFSQSFASLVGSNVHLVFNETKVAPARIQVISTQNDRTVEMLLLTIPNSKTPTSNDNSQLQEQSCHNIQLQVMIRKENVQPGEIFFDPILLTKFCVISSDAPWEEDEDSDGNGTECKVQCVLADNNRSFTLQQLLETIGTVPIPPYLHREAEASDDEAYNTVYAKKKESVAAPTAGLHFTNEMLENIGQQNTSYISLNVGAGTFKPVLVDNALDHSMHSEEFSISVAELRRIIDALKNGKRLIAVGTTTCRTLESLYWCGVRRLLARQDKNDLTLKQMEWYLFLCQDQSITNVEALSSLLVDDDDVSLLPDEHQLHGNTSLMVVPHAYQFQVVDHLVTNFHAPDSTLLLLISALLGGSDIVKRIYADAQRRGYKFLSYGDVCLFSRKIDTDSL